MEYYLAIKIDKIVPFGTKWMSLEVIMLSETSKKKTIAIWFHSYVEYKELKQMN